ncbi:small conductance mechanosensitive channel [Devosia enhydra]|uniref:Small-conductance mechanosensitive channel n=1 Tax=Devosia enhydra TaxID=665118 RepID=A0A1K2HVK8_9HYPH|nr:mechanosensitive ion channel family protein [Devosia enhydra]SFZ82753.1 small conductance mechanosensitive channel [Devosia enhydra]
MTITEDNQLAFAWLGGHALALGLAMLILAIGYVSARWLSGVIKRLLPRAYGVDKNFTPLLAQATYYGVIVLSVVMALNLVGVQSTSILAVLGAAGLAIALALQGTLSNIASGLMLVLLRPVAIGEYITSDGGVSGIVVEIGLFGTRLRTTSGLYVFIPNQKLFASAITNHSREVRRRVDITVTMPDALDIARARKVLLRIATSDRRVLVDPAPTVHVDSFSGSSVTLQLRAWTQTPDYLPTLYALTEEAKLALDRALTGEERSQINVVPDQTTPRPDSIPKP